jgi:energy-converting hydrogenase Eha subunit H
MIQRNAREVSKALIAGSAGGYMASTHPGGESFLYSITFSILVWFTVLISFLILEGVYGTPDYVETSSEVEDDQAEEQSTQQKQLQEF